MRNGIGPQNLGVSKENRVADVKTMAKQTVGGKSSKEINSAADVPKSTSFGGTNYNLGMQDGAGAHYFNEGYDSKHGKKGTIKRPGDSGVYHVSREVAQPVKSLSAKKASIKSPANQTKAKKEDNSYKPTSLGGFGGPRYIAQGAKNAVGAVGNAARKADANISSRAQRSSRKPSAKAGTMQDFMNRGPIGFARNLKNK